ncbi:MAG: family 16 glycosylhydrolase [Schleiferiaceae bacterium]|nr:family 16 glycosylhydrolase [Schleiferiaceae bacterium]
MNQIKRTIQVCALVLSFQLHAQISVIDFSSNLHNFNGFNGAGFAKDVDPTDASNPVGKITNIGGVWEGVTNNLPVDVFLDSIKAVTLKVYKSDSSPTTIILKFRDAAQPNEVEVHQSFNTSGWNTLTFDFTQAVISGTGTPINAEGGYSKVDIFINGGNATQGIYYIDDLTYPNYESANSLDVIYSNLVYADEFGYLGPIDTSAWFPEEVPPNPFGWFNNEKQHYTARTDNVYLSNGTLKIIAKKETYNAYGLTLDYTSARLNSKFSFKYGRIDVRAKIPQGDGTWPAIWMLGTSYGNNWNAQTIPWPACGEIDIMEHWGNDADKIHGSIHNPSSHGATVNNQRIYDEDVFNTWHVYSVNWSPNQISFLMDGFLYYTYKPDVKNAQTWPFDDPQFILLNVAMGGIYPIDPGFVQSQMEIDYVRVYQNVNIGIEEENELINISIYPNPTSGELNIKAGEPGEFKVYDVLGKHVFTQEITQVGNTRIQLPKMPQGLYVWNFDTKGKSASGRLQIVH